MIYFPCPSIDFFYPLEAPPAKALRLMGPQENPDRKPGFPVYAILFVQPFIDYGTVYGI